MRASARNEHLPGSSFHLHEVPSHHVTEPLILVDAPRRSERSRVVVPDSHAAWRWIGWFSLLLALAGIADWVLAWIPMRFGTPEWEFGTIVSSMSGLPLLTMGFAGLLGSAVARGVRWQVRLMSMIVILFALLILAALVIFALDVPIALRTVQGPAHLGILKATAKTVALGVIFSVGYLVAGIGALRFSRGRPA